MDFEKIHQAFEEYVSNYDMNNDNISLKYYHTIEVANISYKIAELLGLNDEEKDLAKLIGYLHDIGRFEQVATTNSFKDNILDHADNGVKLLFDEGLIRKFIEDKKYDEIIKKAVKNHNKYKILDEVNEQEGLFANIIRDADKIDIFRVRREHRQNEIIEPISKEIITSFENNESVKLKDVKTKSDSILCVLAFIFDFNYKESIKVLNETNYYQELIDGIEVSSDNIEIFSKLKKIVFEKLEV